MKYANECIGILLYYYIRLHGSNYESSLFIWGGSSDPNFHISDIYYNVISLIKDYTKYIGIQLCTYITYKIIQRINVYDILSLGFTYIA